MLHIRLQNLNVEREPAADVNLCIMYKPPTNLDPRWIEVPALAPSKALRGWYYDHRDEPDWFATYEAMFREQMARSPRSQRTLRRLLEVAQSGKTIALACTCFDESTCHRSIVRALVLQMQRDWPSA